jgi:DNA end-binding protein Ku
VTFGLVSIPVAIHAAVEASHRVAFRQLHRKDMAPIRYKKFCSEEDVEVPNDEIVRGYEVEKGEYALVEKEELDQVQEELGEGDRTIEIVQFVDFASLNPLLFEKPYYLAPQDGGSRGPTLFSARAALVETSGGIARFYLRTRPSGCPAAEQGVLSLMVMRDLDELRDADDLDVPHAKASAAEVKMARSLVESMSDTWDPTAHPNTYRKALEKLVASKKKFAVEVPETKEGGPRKVVDLMEALRKSLGQTLVAVIALGLGIGLASHRSASARASCRTEAFARNATPKGPFGATLPLCWPNVARDPYRSVRRS